MKRSEKVEILKGIVFDYAIKNSIHLTFNTDKELNNGNIADFQINFDNRSLIIGNFIERKISSGKRDKNYYFRKHPFMRGGYGNCWVFFDGINYVFHNIWMDLPDDNFTSNFNEILDASIEYLKERYDIRS